MQEAARMAGVSSAVMSRVVNADPTLRIREETRQRVLAVIRATDYAPNAAARWLRRAQTDLLVLAVHDPGNPLHAELAAGARQEADRLGKTLILGDLRRRPDESGRLLRLIAAGGVDGFIVQEQGLAADRALSAAAPAEMPHALLQSGTPGANGAVVSLDDATAAETATSHLLELGHRRIGFLGVSQSLAFSRHRQEGWRAALEKAGIAAHRNWAGQGGSSPAEGMAGAARLLQAAPEVTGLVAANVVAAVGALAALADSGRRVPDDTSLVAVHDTELAGFVRPALTAVRMPLGELGARAVSTCVNGPAKASRRIRVTDPSPCLVCRASSGPPGQRKGAA